MALTKYQDEQKVEDASWESLDVNAAKRGEVIKPALNGFGRILQYKASNDYSESQSIDYRKCTVTHLVEG